MLWVAPHRDRCYQWLHDEQFPKTMFWNCVIGSQETNQSFFIAFLTCLAIAAIGDAKKMKKSSFNPGRYYHSPVRKWGLTHRVRLEAAQNLLLNSKWCYNPQCLNSEHREFRRLAKVIEASWDRSRMHLAVLEVMVRFGEVERRGEGMPEGKWSVIKGTEVAMNIISFSVRIYKMKMLDHQQRFLFIRAQ